jgi:hypothetical protein
MNAMRTTAKVTGILFIVATLAGLAGSAVLGSTLKTPDFLSALPPQGNRILMSALLSFIGECASAGIAIALYPVLRKHNEGLALGSVGFRLIEAMFYMVGTLCLLLIFALSQQSAGVAGQVPTSAQALARLLLAAKDLAGFVLGVLAFCIGGAMYYAVFYRTRLIPRWLSVWGMIALVMLFSAVMITLFDGAPYSVSGNLVFLAFPIALQEMVLAVWLIVKGFNRSAVESVSAG